MLEELDPYAQLDRLGRQLRDAILAAAHTKGIAVQVMPASFDEVADAGKSAARNQRLVDACDVLVAFWDGSSKGTRATVERALDSGKEVHVFVAP